MSGDVYVCEVCLRTDRKLDFVQVQLAIFYSELVVELVRFPIKYQNNQFCSDCAHLLRRFYNFRNKCRKANKIMLDWKKLKVHKPPLETLCDFLPNAMGVWTAKGNTIFSFDHLQDAEINYPILTNNANNTLILGGNENLLQCIVPVIAPMSQLINVPTINDNTEIKDPLKLETDDNQFTNVEIQDIQIQDVKTQDIPNINYQTQDVPNINNLTQNVPNINNQTQVVTDINNQSQDVFNIKSIEAETITFIETNELELNEVKLEHDYVDLTDTEVQDVTNTAIKDAVCHEEDFEEFLNFDCLKAANINSKDLDEIDNALSNCDFERNTKQTDVIIVDENIEAIDLTEETNDFGDTIDAVSDDNNVDDDNNGDDDDLSDLNDVLSASDNRRLDNVTTKLTQFQNDLSHMCDVYQKLLPVKNLFELHYILIKALTPKALSLFVKNFDFVIKNHEYTINILKGDKIILKEFAKNTVLNIIDEEDTTSPGGSGIDKEFISQCLIEKEPMTHFKAILTILNNKKTSDAAKKRLIIKRTKRLETSYKKKRDDLSEIFDIEYLNSDRKAREEFERRKTYTCYIKAKSKCKICYLPFKNSRLLDIHMLNHDKAKGQFSCELCKTYYISKKKMNYHITMHHHKVFKCKKCPVIIRAMSSAKDHRNYHKGIKIVCELCNKKFNWKALYYTHRAKVHGCNFICTYCAHAFTCEKKLKEHQVIHQKRKPIGEDNPGVECDDCGLVFISKNICDKHIKRMHMSKTTYWNISGQNDSDEDSSQPVMCEQCGMLLSTKKGLRRHILSHKNVIKKKKKEVQCRVCGITCIQRYDLGLHFKKEHPDLDIDVVYADQKPFMCDHCGKRFQYLCLLRDHILTHSDVKPFACTECPKRYYTQDQLLRHGVYHLPKSKECDVCGKLFRTTANLCTHKRTHTQNRKYKCKHCGKGFLYRASVREHIRGVHHGIRRARKPRTKKTDTGSEDETEPGKGGLDIDNVDLVAEYEISETGDDIIATGDKRTVATRVLRKRRAMDESLKVYAATSKRVRQDSSLESEDTE